MNTRKLFGTIFIGLSMLTMLSSCSSGYDLSPANDTKSAIDDSSSTYQRTPNGPLCDESYDEDTTRRNPTGIISSDGSKIFTGKPITIVGENLTLISVLARIMKHAEVSYISSSVPNEFVSIRFEETPWDQALHFLLKSSKLDHVTEGNIIRIASIEQLRAERQELRQSKWHLDRHSVSVSRLFSFKNVLASEVVPFVRKQLSPSGNVFNSKKKNSIIVYDRNYVVKQISDKLKIIDNGQHNN